MIDRQKGPKIHTEFDLSLKGVQTSQLSNGVQLYEVNSGTQKIIKIELVFRTGRIHEQSKAIARSTLSLIREGSTRHTAEELAYHYDFYGANVKASCNMEHASISLVVLERYFKEVWPVWFHMVFYPAFAEKEIQKYATVHSQRLSNQLAKNDVLSYRELTEQLFGHTHPYGYNTEPEDIKNISRDKILEFYNKNLGLDKAFLLISGHYSAETREAVTQQIGSMQRHCHHPEVQFQRVDTPPERRSVSTQNEIQTSIKTGKLLFKRKHPDYSSMKFLTMVLGGYFGSRLMSNIREDKGYTYGIYASMHGWNEDGFFYISADVDNQFNEPTLAEIRNELNRLRTSLIPVEELEMVRSYILGQTLHLLDGPFAKVELIKNLNCYHQDIQDYQKHIKSIKEITAEELLEIATRYLDPDSFSTVLAGQI